jgi:hypothetical protein
LPLDGLTLQRAGASRLRPKSVSRRAPSPSAWPRQRSSSPLRVAHQRLRDQKIPFGIFQRDSYVITNVSRGVGTTLASARSRRMMIGNIRLMRLFPYAGGARSSSGQARRVL